MRRSRKRRRRNPADNLLLLLAFAGGSAYLVVQGEANNLPPEIQKLYDEIRGKIKFLGPPTDV